MYASTSESPCGDLAIAELPVSQPETATSVPAVPNDQVLVEDPSKKLDYQLAGIAVLIELLLKDRGRLERLLRSGSISAVLLPRLLAISLTGFIVFGLTISLVLTLAGAWPSLTSIATWLEAPSHSPIAFHDIGQPVAASLQPWLSGEVLALVFAYAFGLVAASCVCLPSLYFYCLLAGVRMTMLDVVAHSVKAKAVAAMALIGILPIYLALAMGVVIFDAAEQYRTATLLLGLVLPFIAGLWGTVSLYHGFSQLCDTMPDGRTEGRQCFLRRLVLSWSACYSAVMPIMIFSLWELLSRV